MRVVIQRVLNASVIIERKTYSEIGKGLLILLGIEDIDQEEDIAWLVGKILRLRIFNDESGIMNLSVKEIGGSLLVVSQFTLHASTKKGNRPSYIRASRTDFAKSMYNKFIKRLSDEGDLDVKTGLFAADMQVILTNDGPVTIFIDTKNKE
jgi:D-aminoacyl-tRNA deacylase